MENGQYVCWTFYWYNSNLFAVAIVIIIPNSFEMWIKALSHSRCWFWNTMHEISTKRRKYCKIWNSRGGRCATATKEIPDFPMEFLGCMHASLYIALRAQNHFYYGWANRSPYLYTVSIAQHIFVFVAWIKKNTHTYTRVISLIAPFQFDQDK